MSGGQRAMLRAHYEAPGRKITATQLAQAAGFANFSAANLQYGLLGAMLFAEIPEDLEAFAVGEADQIACGTAPVRQAVILGNDPREPC